MKATALAILALAACVAALAQQPAGDTGAPGLTVVKHNWDKERIGWERDPFGGPVENFDEMRVRARNEKRIDDAKKSGSPDVDRVKREARADAANLEKARSQGPPRYGFRYKLSVRNDGAKAVKEFDWDYVFTDAATYEVMGRHQFTSAERIAPGKSKESSFFIPAPPAHRISVYALDKKERDALDGHVIIIRIVYDDGTVWERR
jgi:hypothetical protein